jgi:hypothetical protein
LPEIWLGELESYLPDIDGHTSLVGHATGELDVGLVACQKDSLDLGSLASGDTARSAHSVPVQAMAFDRGTIARRAYMEYDRGCVVAGSTVAVGCWTKVAVLGDRVSSERVTSRRCVSREVDNRGASAAITSSDSILLSLLPATQAMATRTGALLGPLQEHIVSGHHDQAYREPANCKHDALGGRLKRRGVKYFILYTAFRKSLDTAQ